MTQGDDEEDIGFNVEEVQKIVRDNIELCLGGNIYSHSRTSQWISVITEKTLSKLNKLNKPYKYILRMTVTQKNGSGLHTAAAYFWDTATDGSCTVRWENKPSYCTDVSVDYNRPVQLMEADNCQLKSDCQCIFRSETYVRHLNRAAKRHRVFLQASA